MPQTLKQNNIATIYIDPISEEKEEGRALLIKQISVRKYNKDLNTERWQVQFMSDGFICERSILSFR